MREPSPVTYLACAHDQTFFSSDEQLFIPPTNDDRTTQSTDAIPNASSDATTGTATIINSKGHRVRQAIRLRNLRPRLLIPRITGATQGT